MPATQPPVRPQNSHPYAANYQCLNIALNHIQSRAQHDKYFEVPHSVSSKQQLATMYINSGRFHEAVDLLRQMGKKCKIAFADDHIADDHIADDHIADDHIFTLNAQVELARAYDGLDQLGIGIPLVVDAIEWGKKAGVADTWLQQWRRYLGRYRAHEASLLWEGRTEPFKPDVVISLLSDAIELGEKNGESVEILQAWRGLLQESRSSEATTLSETRSEVDECESNNS